MFSKTWSISSFASISPTSSSNLLKFPLIVILTFAFSGKFNFSMGFKTPSLNYISLLPLSPYPFTKLSLFLFSYFCYKIMILPHNITGNWIYYFNVFNSLRKFTIYAVYYLCSVVFSQTYDIPIPRFNFVS